MTENKIDLSYLEMVAGGDKTFVVSLIDMFLNSLPKDMAQVEAYFSNGDWLQAGRSAHKMKATIQMMGLKELSELVIKIEKIGKSGEETDQLSTLVPLLTEQVNQLIIDLKQIQTELR